jgi:hypothetical protein
MNIIRRLLGFHSSRHERGGETPRAPRISPLVRASSHNDGLALLHIERGQVFLCNRTASRIWEGLSAGRLPEEVAAEMSERYGIRRELAREHTFSFVRELESRGLLSSES